VRLELQSTPIVPDDSKVRYFFRRPPARLSMTAARHRWEDRRCLYSRSALPAGRRRLFADGAWRESFLRVKSVRASLTSSRKQTHIVSASSASMAVVAPAVRATIPCRFKTSAATSAAQSSSRLRPGMQNTELPSLRVSILMILPFPDAASRGTVTFGASCAARSSMISETVLWIFCSRASSNPPSAASASANRSAPSNISS
jgi:hypothetical protein